jgi:hypothetical protein
MLVRAANLWGFQEALDHIWPQCRHAFFDDTLHVVQLSNSEHVRRRRRRTRMLIHARAPTHAHMHDAQRALFCV